MTTVRWGLLSTANINRALIPAIRADPRGELAAVASRNRQSADAYATDWEIPQAFGSYQALLDSDAVDAVYIGLPNHLHAEWTIKALQAGKHVLCEKPFALTLDEVDRMSAAASQHGCALAEAFMYRHHPQTKLVGEWVQQGRLGEIVAVRGVFGYSINPQRRHTDVRMKPEWGGGAMWDVGVYPMSFAQYVMGGPPERVSAEQWLGDSGVDETFVGQLYYSGGRLAQIMCGFRMAYQTSAEVTGTEGHLTLTQPFQNMDANMRLTFYPHGDDPQDIAVPEKPLYLGEVEDMHAAILDGAPNYLTLAETRDHIRTALALYQAARTQQVVHLA